MIRTPAVNDLIILADQPPARVEYVERDVQVVNAYGDRWHVPAKYMLSVGPCSCECGRQMWAIAPAWTA